MQNSAILSTRRGFGSFFEVKGLPRKQDIEKDDWSFGKKLPPTNARLIQGD